MLIWLQEIKPADAGRWVLGDCHGSKTLIDFMGDLHWHLDIVMLLTFVLITFLGYYAMRVSAGPMKGDWSHRFRSVQAFEAAHQRGAAQDTTCYDWPDGRRARTKCEIRCHPSSLHCQD